MTSLLPLRHTSADSLEASVLFVAIDAVVRPGWIVAAVAYGVGHMQEKQPVRDNVEMARRWHALAERRRQHFADLHDSGRWRKYYREHDFLTQMRATANMVDAWERVSRQNGSGAAKVNGTSRPLNGL